MERTLDYVNPQARAWTNDEGKTFYFVEGNFDDGSSGSVFCFSPANAEETIEILRGLVGKSADYDLQAGKEYNGQTQWKIKGFPGKPAGGGGGGGRSGGGGMSHSQAGLLAAASVLTFDAGTPVAVMFSDTVDLAEMFTEHLFNRRKDVGEGETASGSQPEASSTSGVAQSGSPSPTNAITLPQMKRLKELGMARGLLTPEDIAAALEVSKLGDLSTTDAETIIEAWSA